MHLSELSRIKYNLKTLVGMAHGVNCCFPFLILFRS